ncbi:probable cytochrome P450 9f2 [Phlebotomus papatasi]|uniref:probable cytochrome P450 9f2 n=1 Tax=Phlebotomus papatasi TaxID=29031 RepID=UPI0024838E41|nr:probable cytochrome P450 9f2 [Phlebotomus papatasi]
MLFEFLIYAVLGLLVYYIYQFGTKNENFFLERGLKFRKPVFLFGNNFPVVSLKNNLFDLMRGICRDFPKEKLIGYYDFRTPFVVVLDPEILKQLTIKEFENFTDHVPILSEDSDPLFGNALFSLRGHKWKDMRATLSPAFTGSKMRLMCDLMVEICEQMVIYLKDDVAKNGLQIHEAKKLISRLAIDIIGTCAFGVKVDSLKDKENEFYVTASNLINLSGLSLQIKLAGYRMFPKIMKRLKIPLFPEGSRNFMKTLILNTIRTREEKNIKRPDMINLLMDAQKGDLIYNAAETDSASAGFATVEESEIGRTTMIKRSWTDDELVAQCFIFFLAGFEGLSNITSFVIYEIMVNKDVQDKLYKEVSRIEKDLDGKSLKYDTLQQLKYLDMVVSEVLRKWGGPFVDRICTKDFTLKYDGNKEYTFYKGESFVIPITVYHHNPEFFPNPEKFDPERFSDEKNGSINSSTYIPFGIGPRNCIGSRFALMEIKAIVYYLVLNFHIEQTDKTQIPIRLANTFAGLMSEKGVHVQFRPRY